MPRHAIDGDTIGSDFGGSLRAITQKSSARLLAIIQAVTLDLFAAPAGNVTWNSQRITNLQDPISAQDAATRNYVDGRTAGGVIFKGNWNATTNSPTLVDGTGTAGWEYAVTTAGTQNLGSGSQTFAIGDLALYNGTTWQKVSGSATTYTAGTNISIASNVISVASPLPVANGGTGVTAKTGTGNVVLSTSPALTTPTGIVASDVGLGSVTNDAQLKIASNLADLASAATARTNLSVAPYGRTTVTNTNYSITATDREVAQIGGLTATRTFTLPLASAVPAGWRVSVVDESASATTTNSIIVAKQGSDTLTGTATITTAGGSVELFSNGTSKWTTISPAIAIPVTPTAAGFTYYLGSLDRFRFAVPTATNTPVDLIIAGDSTVEELSVADDMVAQLSRAWGRELGPVLGPGFRGMWRGTSDFGGGGTTDQQEWGPGRTIAGTVMASGTRFVGPVSGCFAPADVGQTITGAGIPNGTIIAAVVSTVAPHTSDSALLSQTATLGATTATVVSDVAWTKTASTDAFDVGPFGECYYVLTGTAATTIHWTKPSTMTSPVVAFDLLYGDVGTGGGPIQYVLDDTQNGWATISTTRVGANVLRRVRVQATIATRITFRTQGAPIGFVGIIPYYLNPATTQGTVVHNLGRFGAFASAFAAGTSGDRMALISGHPGSLNPSLVTAQFYNDITLNNTTNWQTALNAIVARCQPVCDTILVNIWEGGTPSPSVSAAYRAMTKTVALAAKAAGTPVGVIDLYDLLSAYGYTGYTAVNAAGYMNSTDGAQIHPSQTGANVFASAYHRYLNQNS